MKRLLTATLAAMMVLTVAGASMAQGWFDVENPHPNTVKVGGVYPWDSAVREATDDIWFYGAYERVIREKPEDFMDVTFEIGVLNHSDLVVVPITLNWRQFIPDDSLLNPEYYWGAGFGAYSVDSKIAGLGGDTTKLGANIFVGMQRERWLAELKYHYAKAGDDQVGGILATIGIRF